MADPDVRHRRRMRLERKKKDRNPIAKDLLTKKYRQRIVEDKKKINARNFEGFEEAENSD